jgi:hypothetical protein
MSSADEAGERRGLLPRFTLKDGDTFLLADALGDIQSADDGLFTNDTRMLSRFDLFVAGRRPSLLGAAINRCYFAMQPILPTSSKCREQCANRAAKCCLRGLRTRP